MSLLAPKQQDLTKKIVKKWFWLYFFWYLSAPIWYLIRVIISNSPEVSVSDFWVFYSVISLITILYTYNDLWLTESLQYFLPKFYIHKEYNNLKTTIYFSLLIQIITWIIIASLLWFWSDRLAQNYFSSPIASSILKYFCFYFIWTNILQVIQSIFLAFQKTFEYKITWFIEAVSIALFTIYFFLSWEWNIEHYSASRLLGLVITLLFSVLLLLKYREIIVRWILKFDKGLLRKYFNYAVWALIWNSMRNIFWQIILQMVVYNLWSESAWYYSNFLSLFWIGITILWPIRALLYPLVSEYKEKSENKSIENLIYCFYSYFSVIVLSLSVLFITLGPEISVTLFWDKYQFSWVLLSYSWIYLIFNLLASFNSRVLAWLWKVKERVFITTISCIVTIFASYIFIRAFNIYWACIAFGISNIVNRILNQYQLKKQKFSIRINNYFVFKNIVIFTILWTIIYYIKPFIFNYDSNRLINLISLIWIGIIFYSIALFFNKETIIKIKKS